MSKWVFNHKLISYFFLAYLFSWIISIPLILGIVPLWFHYFTAYGPALAAIVVNLLVNDDCERLKLLFKKTIEWKISWLWYLFALSPLLIFLVVSLFLNKNPLDIESLGTVNFLPSLGLSAIFLWILTSGVGEEMGWRGFALPTLQAKYSALKSALILGLFWAGWHIPAFFYLPTYMRLGFTILPMFILGIITGSIVYTWLFNSTDGNILIAILFHGIFNFVTASKAAEGLPDAIVSTLVMIWAVMLIIIYKPGSLSRNKKFSIG